MKPALKRPFKDQLFEQFARIGKALSNGRRLELLELLAQRERTVEELATEAAMSVQTARSTCKCSAGPSSSRVDVTGSIPATGWPANRGLTLRSPFLPLVGPDSPSCRE